LCRILLTGTRFDFSTILYYFFPFYFFALIILFHYHKIWKILASISLVIGILFTSFLSAFDVVYYEYSNRRSSPNILIGIKDATNTYSDYIKEFWWFILLIIILIAFVLWVSKKISPSKKSALNIWQKCCFLGLFLPIYYIGIIGMRNRPLSPSTALLYDTPKNSVLITNTPQTFLYSFYKGYQSARIPSYFSEEELNDFYTIKRHSNGDTMKTCNVVLFILESFSRDVLTTNHQYKAKTPFLDSLMANSLVFENAYANGGLSAFGLVSVLGGIPPLIETPYYHSQYKNNDIRVIGQILKDEGYDTNFFLGTIDNSFGFRECTNIFGIENYYSQTDFKEYKKHRGAWGVFDKPYFQFVKNTLDQKSSPFFATIFNISSHSPYLLPDNEDKKLFYHAEQTREQNAISYVDHALQTFFESAKKSPWYENTLFIFVADHWGQPSSEKERTLFNKFEIPLFLYHPSDATLIGKESGIAQQLDVVPTILNYLQYDKNFMSFGQSLLNENRQNYTFNYRSYIHHIANDSLLLGYHMETGKSTYLYLYKKDKSLKNNLIDSHELIPEIDIMEKAIKARIQRYYFSMEKNKLLVE